MATRQKVQPQEHPLEALIPDPSYAESYISRTINGVRDLDVLRYAQSVQKNVLMEGDTGPGKTAMVMAFASEFKLPLVTVACNGGIDPNTFWGGYQPDPATNGIQYGDSDVTQVIALGGVLYLDEPNFMPPKTSAVFHPLLDRRRFITIMEQGNRRVFAHDDTVVISSMNNGYAGTRPLNAAFKNRFAIKLSIDYSFEVESKLLYMPIMLEIADKLRNARKSGDLATPTSTNMLIEFEELAYDMELPFAIDNFVAAYEAEERDAVRTVFELSMHDLELQVEQMTASVTSD